MLKDLGNDPSYEIPVTDHHRAKYESSVLRSEVGSIDVHKVVVISDWTLPCSMASLILSIASRRELVIFWNAFKGMSI